MTYYCGYKHVKYSFKYPQIGKIRAGRDMEGKNEDLAQLLNEFNDSLEILFKQQQTLLDR